MPKTEWAGLWHLVVFSFLCLLHVHLCRNRVFPLRFLVARKYPAQGRFLEKVGGIVLFSLLPAVEALLCHKHLILITSYPSDMSQLGVTILFSQLLSSFCRKQAQSPNTSCWVTATGRMRPQENLGPQDPLALSKSAWGHRATPVSPHLPCAFPFYVSTPCAKSCTLVCIHRFPLLPFFFSGHTCGI